MNPVTSWRDQALALETSRPEPGGAASTPIDLTHPQPNFYYPPFPLLTNLEMEQPGACLIKKIQAGDLAKHVTLYSDYFAATADWLARQKNASNSAGPSMVVTQGPATPELVAAARSLGIKVHCGSRDIEDFFGELETIQSSVCGICLSNPHRLDGYFLSSELFFRFYQRLREQLPTVAILSDESLGLFSFNQIAPGSLMAAAGVDEQLTLLGSVYPAMSPQGPATTWLIEARVGKVDSNTADLLPKPALQAALAAFNAFESRQGKAVAEFSRRMLAVDRGLKTLAVHLQKLSVHKILRVPLWPEAGFYLRLEMLQDFTESAAAGSAAADLYRATGCLLIPGSVYDRPREMALCYAAPIALLDEAGRRLVQYFLKA